MLKKLLETLTRTERLRLANRTSVLFSCCTLVTKEELDREQLSHLTNSLRLILKDQLEPTMYCVLEAMFVEIDINIDELSEVTESEVDMVYKQLADDVELTHRLIMSLTE